MLKLYVLIGNLDSKSFIEIFHVITCIPVSYTHLDVYKRQDMELLWKVLKDSHFDNGDE